MEWLEAVPLWAWVAAAAAVWYPTIAFVLRWAGFDGRDPMTVIQWLLSPVLVIGFGGLLLVAAAASVPAWLLSFGLVRPFWQWRL